MNIIIVDDDNDYSLMIQSVLRRMGFNAILDPNGQKIERLHRDLPDLIILDINLCNGDGGDLCTKIKSDINTKHIPILLISALMDLQQICQLCGADGYLIKPFNKSDFEMKVLGFANQFQHQQIML